MRDVKLKGRIVRLLILAVICISSLLLGLSYYFTNKATQSSVKDELITTSNLVSAVLDNKYPGTWALDGEKLTKGKSPLHDIVGIIDEIKVESNCEITIFSNDTIFMTTLVVDNKRIVGTKADEKVVETILKNGEEFQDQITVGGVKYIGKYTPIKNGKSAVVGMIFVGKEYSMLMKPLTQSIVYMVSSTIIVAILMIILGVLFASRVAKPISISVNALKRVSSGDLTENIPNNLLIRKDEAGELAEAVQDMQNFLNSIVNNIKDTTNNMFSNSSNLLTVSENMSAASSNITHAIGEMASGTVGQAEDISNISQSLNEFGEKIQQAKDATNKIHDGSMEVEKMTYENNQEMKKVVISIGHVKNQFDEFANSVSVLGDNITRVDEITGVINSIADQTNLLALNAAIEAARAGESGKGFAVVADEIRKLAEESRRSSESIKELVTFIAKDTYKIVDNSKEVNNKLVDQLEAINKTLGSFEGISKSVSDMIPKINQVDKTTESINDSKTVLISKAENAASIAEEISAATEEIAASSEEMASSAVEVEKVSEALNLETKKLIDYISIFKSK